MGFNFDGLINITSSVLLFFLVFGMSATVDIDAMRAQVKNTKAIATGVFLQFVILPFLGFASAWFFNLDNATGITLLVVTASPGGSYSNWWCSMFNADLALSVTMTAMSTLLSTIMLPLNLVFYSKFLYRNDVVDALDWKALITALIIVIGAISLGLFASAHHKSATFNRRMNSLGNAAGISLILFSAVMSNTSSGARIWNREGSFYLGVAIPCVLGLVIANLISSSLWLLKPERVTVSIECCYQNVGIATSVALAMFNGENQALAVAVPFYYGVVEAVLILGYCLVCWKIGWTKAPAGVSFWTMISTSYEILQTEETEKLADDDYCYVEQGDTATSSTDPKEPSTKSTT